MHPPQFRLLIDRMMRVPCWQVHFKFFQSLWIVYFMTLVKCLGRPHLLQFKRWMLECLVPANPLAGYNLLLATQFFAKKPKQGRNDHDVPRGIPVETASCGCFILRTVLTI
jgi:hypothetical protein